MSKGGTVSVSYVVNNSEFNTKVNDMKRNMSLPQAEVKNSAKEVEVYGSNIQTLSKKHSTINDAIIIKNSVIYGDVKVGKVNGVNITLNLDNNWWGSNNATYYNAVISLSSGYNSVITELSKEIATPDNYLVLTLDVTNKTDLMEPILLIIMVLYQYVTSTCLQQMLL